MNVSGFNFAGNNSTTLRTKVSSAAYLSPLALVLAVLGEEAAEEVSAAAGHVDQRALLPQTETR